MTFANAKTLEEALVVFEKKDRLLVVTMGEKGSLCYFNGQTFIEESQKVTPIDTTGAGDAFYGTFLANIESKAITENTIRQALRKANEVGAKTTLHYGTIV